MQITAQQIRTIHAVLPTIYRQDKELKQNLIAQFTEDDNKTSTKDLSQQQAEELIYFLKTGKAKTYDYYASFDFSNRQHRYLLSLCHQIGWEVFSERAGKLVVDTEALGRWLHKYGYLHKTLKEYSENQLPKLITQFENMVKSVIKKRHDSHSN